MYVSSDLTEDQLPTSDGAGNGELRFHDGS